MSPGQIARAVWQHPVERNGRHWKLPEQNSAYGPLQHHLMDTPLLSAQQRASVEHAAGPLLIVAGAGTGKTLVIAHRIAHLIASKRAKPHEILALTFTESAATEMEERVDRLVPYGYTDVALSTFHAFGDRILRENGIRLGLTPDFRVLSRAEQALFVRCHLFEFPLSSLRPLGDPTKHIDALLSVISRLKDEDISPAAYLTYVQQERETPSLLPDELSLHDEVARTYETYQSLLIQNGCIDFGDQVYLTLQLLRTYPSILNRYQTRFQYILVDEFQDTNHAQFQLIHLLAARHGSITVVGDDDQSIYKFRGAAISNIISFREHYKDAACAILTENYRSTQPILDAAYRLIQYNNPDRLEVREQIDKRLIARSPDVFSSPVQHWYFDTVLEEAGAIAEMIFGEVQSGAAYHQFALLVRANNHADDYLRALNMKGIPYRFSGMRGLYNTPEVRVLIAFMRATVDRHNSGSLYALAASPLYAFPPDTLLDCMTQARRTHGSLYDVLCRVPQKQAFGVPSPNEAMTPEAVATTEKLLRDLAHAQMRASEVPAGVVLYEFIKAAGFLRQDVTASPEETRRHEARLQNIAKFFKEIKRFEQWTPTPMLHDVIAYLDLIQASGEDPPSAEATDDTDAVSVLTVHKAKGLEFDTVFMVGLVDGNFPSRNRGEAIEIPDALVQEALPTGNIHLQEERRLFYVGMTRARCKLYLTAARDLGGRRPRKISPFVLEALGLPIQVIPPKRTSPQVAIIHRGEMEPTAAPSTPTLQGPLGLTYYQIDDYLTCPLKYKYSHILKVPIYQHHTVVYGNAIHQAVAGYLSTKNAEHAISLDEVIAIFDRAWHSEGFISREHEEQRLEAGHLALQRFYHAEARNERKPTHIEKPFSFFFEENRIGGRWDRIDEEAEGGIVIDYKTSAILDQKTADQKTKESRQLTLYAWAYLEQFGTLPARVSLYFIDSGIIGQGTRTMKHIEAFKDEVREVARHIRDKDFSARPTYMACRYCAYQDICSYAA